MSRQTEYGPHVVQLIHKSNRVRETEIKFMQTKWL